MAKKPTNLIYGVEDKPPLAAAILLGLQHVSVLSVAWIFVMVIVTGIGGTREQAEHMIQMSMIVPESPRSSKPGRKARLGLVIFAR